MGHPLKNPIVTYSPTVDPIGIAGIGSTRTLESFQGGSHQNDDLLSIKSDSGRSAQFTSRDPGGFAGLYTPDQRRRRDKTPWTLVQGVLAPVQFLIFLVSLGLVLHFLLTGRGIEAATISVVVKTLALYAIMITGSIWEKVVFGRYLFAPAFFWEDVFSMIVLALHTAYLAALFAGALDPRALMLLALAAYATYAINAGQFILKLRAARLQGAQLGFALAGARS